jgi:hypothetical protein
MARIALEDECALVHEGKRYKLVPEQEDKLCIGCAFQDTDSCTRFAKLNCIDGYIFKESI